METPLTFFSELKLTILCLHTFSLQQISTNEYCENHEGQQKQYFCTNCSCVTCSDCGLLDPTHRGHQFIRLREAARIRRASLRDHVMEVKQLEQMYDVAIHQTEQVERNIEQSATEEKLAFQRAKNELFQQIEDFAKIYDQNIDINKEVRTKKVCHVKGKLRVKQAKAKSTREEAVSVVQSGSEYQVVSRYCSKN